MPGGRGITEPKIAHAWVDRSTEPKSAHARSRGRSTEPKSAHARSRGRSTEPQTPPPHPVNRRKDRHGKNITLATCVIQVYIKRTTVVLSSSQYNSTYLHTAPVHTELSRYSNPICAIIHKYSARLTT